jgi:hypothetical protein
MPLAESEMASPTGRPEVYGRLKAVKERDGIPDRLKQRQRG